MKKKKIGVWIIAALFFLTVQGEVAWGKSSGIIYESLAGKERMQGQDGQPLQSTVKLKSIRITLITPPKGGGLHYRLKARKGGWLAWQTTSKAGEEEMLTDISDINIRLMGKIAKEYDVLYAVQRGKKTWSPWAKNGENTAFKGQSGSFTDIRIKLTKKKVKKKYVALTFDDGPSPRYTRKILQALKKEQVTATFFVLGEQVKDYPDIVKEISDNGHEIGNHSYDHKNLIKLSAASIKSQIRRTDQQVLKAAGQAPSLFRPPYGSINKTVKGASDKPLILWDVDTEDWRYRDSSRTVSFTSKYARSNSIILMHDIQGSTAKAVPQLIRQLKRQGFEFLTVSELLEETPQAGHVYATGLSK